jgi:hypothetical protein
MTRMSAKIAWMMLTGAATCAAGSEPQRRLTLDFDQKQAMAAKGASAIVDSSSDQEFRATIDKGTRAADRPQLVSQGCHTPPSCLRISLDPSAKGAAKNKIMYSFWSHYKSLPGGEQGRMVIGDNRVTRIRFAMKLGDNYDTPPHQMIHFQIFQPKDVGKASKVKTVNPGGPILSLRIVPQSRRKDKSPDVQDFIIVARNPQAQNLKYYDRRDNGVLFRGQVRKGDWNNFSFVLQSTDKDGRMIGRVAFWLNDVKKVDHPVEWGFDPKRYGVSSKLGFELGSYRSADPNGHQTVYFDDITLDR